MSSRKGYRSFSNSYGQFWFGGNTFPGFLYKKNLGSGTRRSTLFTPGGTLISNQPNEFWNKYKPGTGGIGASTISNRRAKNRYATICATNNCFPCYMTLGQYSNYTHNPNGFIPCPTSNCAKIMRGNILANMNITGMNNLIFSANDDGYAYLPFLGMDYYFFGKNYGKSDGTDPSKSIYMCTNYAFGFGNPFTDYENWPSSGQPAILFDFYDSYNFNSYVSPPQIGLNGSKYVRLVTTGTSAEDYDTDPTTIKKAYEILYITDACYQYMQFNCYIEDVDVATYYPDTQTNITDGLSFLNTFGSFGIPPNIAKAGNSYVIRSDLNGNNWRFFPNYHVFF